MWSTPTHIDEEPSLSQANEQLDKLGKISRHDGFKATSLAQSCQSHFLRTMTYKSFEVLLLSLLHHLLSFSASINARHFKQLASFLGYRIYRPITFSYVF